MQKLDNPKKYKRILEFIKLNNDYNKKEKLFDLISLYSGIDTKKCEDIVNMHNKLKYRIKLR